MKNTREIHRLVNFCTFKGSIFNEPHNTCFPCIRGSTQLSTDDKERSLTKEPPRLLLFFTDSICDTRNLQKTEADIRRGAIVSRSTVVVMLSAVLLITDGNGVIPSAFSLLSNVNSEALAMHDTWAELIVIFSFDPFLFDIRQRCEN